MGKYVAAVAALLVLVIPGVAQASPEQVIMKTLTQGQASVNRLVARTKANTPMARALLGRSRKSVAIRKALVATATTVDDVEIGPETPESAPADWKVKPGCWGWISNTRYWKSLG